MMPTIELSQEAYDRLIFLSAQIGHPMDAHCGWWVEETIWDTPADSETAESAFHNLVDEGAIVAGEAFAATDLLDEVWGWTRRKVQLAVDYGLFYGRLRHTQDGYVLVPEDVR